MWKRSLGWLTAVTLAVGLTACDDATGPESTVSLGFRTATGSGSASVSASRISASHVPSEESLVIDGTNGRLEVEEVHFIVSEFELERVGEDDCEEAVNEDACEEFEAPMQFLPLPLSGDAALAVTQAVPEGSYDEMEFEIEELEDDEEDDEGAEIETLLGEIRNQFPDWPRQASLRVHGTFTPKDDQGNLLTDQERAYTAFFEAEIEIEREFADPLVVDGEMSESVTVVVDPALWFERPDGTVRDLSQLDFDPATGGPVTEFEVEIENGFLEVEHDG